MRNCLPKFSKVFRRKSSAKSSSSSAGRENPSNEPDSDTEPYSIAIAATSDRSGDNRNERPRTLPDDDSIRSRLISAAHLDLDLGLGLDSDSPAMPTNGGLRPKSEGACPEMKVETISAATSPPRPLHGTPGPVAISLPFVGRNSSKTPEEMELEYEANVEAESRDIMTPLRRNTRPLSVSFGGGGRSALQPEIVEAIRSLDVPGLLLNNLSLDGSTHPKGERSHAAEEEPLTPGHDHEDSVVLRRKVICLERKTHSLYERRLPKVPKLHLHVAGKKQSPTEEEEFRTFQRNLMDLKYPTVLPPNPPLKALLVFHKSDSICEAITAACQRHQLDVTLVKSKEEALDTLQKSYATAQCYHLIIIDARSSKNLDAEHIARTIRHTHGHHLTTIIAVCKKSFFEKDDVLIALLDAGVNRCVAETTNLAMCSVELKQILHSIIRPHNVMSTQQALYTALHRLKEVVLITDDLLRIQYANRATERLLNMRLDEIISKQLEDIFVSDLSTISEQCKNIKEFDGILTVRRKSQEGIPMHVRVVPVACIGSAPTHLIFNFDVPGGQMDFIATLPQPKEAPRGSLHSVRRCSFDVRSIASDGLRRTSLAKLTSLPLEAPITKENCSADEARLIDKVLEFLKREGLYSPQMKEIRTDDPIATDLIGALLTGPSVYSSRRSSNDSIIRTGSSTRTAAIVPAKMKSNPIIMELLDESLSWDFDIFKLEEITDYHPLLYLGMEMFRRFDVFATLNIDENVCKAWLAVIEAHYRKSNTYHNSTHAADVMQATGAFITQLTNKDMLVMDRMEEATALIAAAAHDVDHPGRSSAFLCNSNDALAVLYNDLTVLENHHAAITFKLTLGDDKINIFKNLDKETYKSARSTIIDMILATEMTRHFEHLAKFVSVFGGEEPRDHNPQTDEETSILMRRMLIKVADVSNPARPMQFCIEWARRIAEEYFMQTDEEKQRHLPIVMPMFDRATCSIPKSQIGFIEYIIQDMMHAWESFIDMPQLITYMQINYSQWKKYDEQGVNTLAEIMAKQPPVGKMANSK
ncbi:high affinity cAMP-specific and IBMX-insensitive 3',5'-cyclic phosphodiesterase 8 isoform X2 [Drosophila santomea]|uniref:high affinity cAMP-specific and IBMX-insensitive 3',5'-cyclic phosphodiesterase 8 isoform X2 n=1 Tax=Drosophila santomea TaxID=129105 RepID=UPI001952F0EE|nr:high affinity cAMP-specific and IBMX-insensitive 3',5'-cyclic phosphodiesterase 8 isoform X2 [Drosophila santomea]